MTINFIHRAAAAVPILLFCASCESQVAPVIANPIADESRAQAHQLVLAGDACRKDASVYRQQHPQAGQCGSGVIAIGLAQPPASDSCGTAILDAIPSCKQWDDSYRMIAGADHTKAAPTPLSIELMETKEADPGGGAGRY